MGKKKTSARCRICQEPMGRADFTLKNAPESVNDLPKSLAGRKKHCSDLPAAVCASCGFVQLLSAPVKTWSHAVTAAGLSAEMRLERLGQFKRFKALAGLSAQSEVWEIGCSSGLFLDVLKKVGLKPKGLEDSAEMVKAARASGRSIKKGHPEKGGLRGVKADAMVCVNFIEHTPNPLAFLRALKKALKPGGWLLIEAPDFEKDLAQGKSHNFVAEHLSSFTERTLSMALELAGFEIKERSKFWHGDDIEIIAQVRSKPDLRKWDERDPALVALREIMRVKGPAPWALWGASHQGLALLGMLSKKPPILAIGDSAPRKQGRFEPAWGIPIVSPERMLAKNPKSVLIMCAGFSWEAARQLREQHAWEGRAWILADGKLSEV